ncbi:hypothetical protein [Actinacidiphila acididurans]|uniref:Helix-turn-helix domain-containing protein n=1 Tax=Actinacidiphila acididurans TaxID=2784346 RepID=A0ABS2TTR0_9ACTN|nr:hypothetical protein [Actinacidiphila acididurans]MBM9506732.1 hypothetical protein [Actinacidiphila acididurans]
MSNDQEQPPGCLTGCPPHEFGNALAWKWTREMPPTLKGGFLTLLYAMRAMAAASGELRFSGDGRPIRIQDIAKAAGCREKDARRYLEAAVLSGVVAVIGERRRGKPTLYALVLGPVQHWEAGAAHLRATRRTRKAPEPVESSGHSGPNFEVEVRATAARTEEGWVQATAALTDADEVRATAARMGSGHGGPIGSGRRGPNNPGSNQELPQEVAEVVPQPQERAGARADDQSPEHDGPAGTAARPGGGDPAQTRRFCACGQRLLRADRNQCGGCLRKTAQKPVQGAFLLPLTGGARRDPPKAHWNAQWPLEDPAAPARVCACGREYRLTGSDCCPACVHAAQQQDLGLAVGR